MSALTPVTNIHAARPFMKAVGGKTKLLPELHKHIPYKFGRYFEPFVGGGSLFFSLAPRKAALNDANPHMMATYASVRDDVEGLIRALQPYVKGYSNPSLTRREEFFYTMRERQPNPAKDPLKAAAWFMFLNRTCFNGLWRTNKKGSFNTPHGKWKSPPNICNAEVLRATAKRLRGVRLTTWDFEKACVGAKKGDFIYYDSPYWPVSATSDFTAYTKEPFGPAEQERLRDLALRLKRQGVHVLLSNADVAPVRKLYAKGFLKRVVLARRNINSVAVDRGHVNELLIW